MVDHIDVPETMHIEAPVVQPPPAEPIAREPGEEGGEPVERVREPTARELAMEAIFKNRERAIAKELHYGEDLADNARRDAGEQPLQHERLDVDEPEAPAAQAAAAPAPASPVPPQPPAPAAPEAEHTQIITVSGVQYRVTDAQLAQLASVGAVALDAANRDQQERIVQAQRQQQGQQPHPQQQRPQQQPQAPQQQRPMLSPEEAAALSRRLQYGNDTEGAAAVADMAQLIEARVRASNPQINPQALAQYATQQAIQQIQQQQALNFNLQTVGQEYPDVFADEGLSQLAALKLHGIRKRDQLLGVQKSDLVAYREACEEVRGVIYKNAPAQPQPTQDPVHTLPSQASPTSAAAQASRFQAKRAAPRSPQPAQRVIASETQERRYPSSSEIVAQMKKQRGQVV